MPDDDNTYHLRFPGRSDVTRRPTTGPQPTTRQPSGPIPVTDDFTPPPQPPAAGDPPHLDIEATLTQLHGLAHQLAKKQAEMDKKVTGMTELTPEQMAALRENGQTAALSATIDKYEKQLGPWRKVWAFVAAVGAVAIFIFGVGVSYQQFMGGNATKNDITNGIEEHTAEDLEPVRGDVEQIKQDLVPVKSGVEELVEVQQKEQQVKKLKRQLERHDKEYQEALQEYTADKAAGRRTGPRPRKTPDHIKLEAEVKEAEDKL